MVKDMAGGKIKNIYFEFWKAKWSTLFKYSERREIGEFFGLLNENALLNFDIIF